MHNTGYLFTYPIILSFLVSVVVESASVNYFAFRKRHKNNLTQILCGTTVFQLQYPFHLIQWLQESENSVLLESNYLVNPLVFANNFTKLFCNVASYRVRHKKKRRKAAKAVKKSVNFCRSLIEFFGESFSVRCPLFSFSLVHVKFWEKLLAQIKKHGGSTFSTNNNMTWEYIVYSRGLHEQSEPKFFNFRS